MNLLSWIFYITGVGIIFSSIGNLTGEFGFAMFWDLPSILFIFSGVILIFSNFKFSEIIKSVKVSLSDKSIDRNELMLGQKVIETLWNKILLSTIFLIITGFIQMFAFMNDTSKLGPFLALNIIGLTYCLSLKMFVILPMEVSIKKKLLN